MISRKCLKAHFFKKCSFLRPNLQKHLRAGFLPRFRWRVESSQGNVKRLWTARAKFLLLYWNSLKPNMTKSKRSQCFSLWPTSLNQSEGLEFIQESLYWRRFTQKKRFNTPIPASVSYLENLKIESTKQSQRLLNLRNYQSVSTEQKLSFRLIAM